MANQHLNSTIDGNATNTSLHNYPVLIAAPGVVIALSSVVLDTCLPPDRYFDRLSIQVKVLLCAALQHATVLLHRSSEDDAPYDQVYDLTSVCVYATVFLSMVSASTEGAAALRIPAGLLNSWKRASELARLLPPASLVPHVYALTLLRDSVHLSLQSAGLHMVASFVGAVLVMTLKRTWRSARERRLQNLAGIPIVGNGGERYEKLLGGDCTDDARCDASRWYDWSPRQVSQWVSKTMPDESLRNVASRLESEKIDGAALEVVTMDELRSFGIPYGDAVRLKQHIEELTARFDGKVSNSKEHRYMYRSRRYGPSAPHAGGFVDAEQWLDGVRMSKLNLPSSNCAEEQMDPQVSERAKQLFEERFAMELPEMRSASATLDISMNRPREDQEVDDATTQNEVQALASAGTSTRATESSDIQLDDAVLSSMPPDIREIAIRRPGLVRKLLANRSHNNESGLRSDTNEQQSQQADETASNIEAQPHKLNPAVLETMPHHIREIISRRPDLVATVLEPTIHDGQSCQDPAKKKLAEQTKTSSHLSRVKQAMMNNPSYADRFVGAQAAAELSGLHTEGSSLFADETNTKHGVDSYRYTDEDAETVGLLRRRQIR